MKWIGLPPQKGPAVIGRVNARPWAATGNDEARWQAGLEDGKRLSSKENINSAFASREGLRQCSDRQLRRAPSGLFTRHNLTDDARTRDALRYIPANCDRDYWVRIGMAIKSGHGESGFELWDTWSRQADSYNAADARSAWNSFDANGGITIGTLFHEAKAHGWIENGNVQVGREPPTPEVLGVERQKRAEAEAAPEQSDRAERQQEAAGKALALWKAATDAGADHPYLMRKGIGPVNTLRELPAAAVARVLGYQPKAGGEILAGRLLIAPVVIGDDIKTAELIDENGRKSAIAGGAKAGGCWYAQDMPGGDGAGVTILIAEGVATAISAGEATGHVVVAALSNGQLKPVALILRNRYPAATLVILADLKKVNGAPDQKAMEAAKSVGALLAVPDFGSDRPDGATDFNDMAHHCGLQAVKKAVDAAAHPSRADGHASCDSEVLDPISGAGFVGFAGSSDGHSGKLETVEWADPLPIPSGLLPVEPFTAELLPESVRDAVMDIAERMQCPPDFPAVATMVGLSSVIGRKACIRPKRHDDWTVAPNLWGVIVGRPGVMKSPALSESLKPLDRLAAAAGEAYAKAIQDHDLRIRIQDMATKSAEKKAQDLVSKGKTGEAEQVLRGASAPDDSMPPVLRRYKVTDSTVEALGEILMENPFGTLAYRDELHGLLRSLDKDGQEGSRAFYLQSYDGNQGYTFDRIARGRRHIPAVCLSMLGGIQPGKLQSYIRDAMTGGGGDDGLLQRFGMLVWPDVGTPWRNVDRWPDTQAKARAFETFQRLDSLTASIDSETGEAAPTVYRFSDGAQLLFEDWRHGLENDLRSDAHHPAVESHLAKYRKLVPAIALVCALADGETEVSETSIRRALGWAEYLKSHALRAYAAGSRPGTAGAVALLAKIRSGAFVDGFTARDVYVKEWSGLSSGTEVQSALDMLCELNHLHAIKKAASERGGRPSVVYLINPRSRQER
jgi:putative DNA primase/helicase